ncbi:ABC transporter permease [Aquimonas sp.]|jgi:putative ABC transport system permease protein|uniref:ABC transporter permease n=1 Tax=Aquimonas sp. TaxID=1872588 RepID=UPI0037BE71FE
MFGYNLKLAWASIRHRKALAALMVALISIGVGAVMTMVTVVYNMGSDPLPGKSDRLFVVQLDNQENDGDRAIDQNDLPERLTWRDAVHLLDQRDGADEVVALFNTQFAIVADTTDARPRHLQGIATNAAFFRLFEVPFQYGGPWSAEADASGTPQIVIDRQLNEQLFGGENSVGRRVRLGSLSATITGVIGNWTPNTRFYDSSMNPTFLHQAFVPLQFAVAANLSRAGNPMSCWERDEDREDAFSKADVEGLMASECTFVNLWVELADAAAIASYRQFLLDYIADQREFGRFPRETLSFVTGLGEWMVINRAVRPQFKMFVVVAALFMIICLTNLVSIVLAKLMGKTREICVRRAMGADRMTLFVQNLIEVGIVGAVGGVLALALSYFGLAAMRALMSLSIGRTSPMFDRAFELDLTMALTAIALAVAGATIAGLYPVWRACRASPAFNLKTE